MNYKIIEELKATIKQKTNFIKVLKEELKEKEDLPTQEEYDKLNYNYENNLNELNSAQKIIKNKNEEIDNLKMKLESIMAQNKNMKNVIVKKIGKKIAVDFRLPIAYRRMNNHYKKEDLIPIKMKPRINLEDILYMHNSILRKSVSQNNCRKYSNFSRNSSKDRSTNWC